MKWSFVMRGLAYTQPNIVAIIVKTSAPRRYRRSAKLYVILEDDKMTVQNLRRSLRAQKDQNIRI